MSDISQLPDLDEPGPGAGALRNEQAQAVRYALDASLERQTKERPKYPLSLTKEECLKLGTRNGPGSTYLQDSLRTGKEIVEDPIGDAWKAGGAEAFNKWKHEGREAWYDKRRCPACDGPHGPVVWRGVETNFYFTSGAVPMADHCPCRDWWHFTKLLESKMPPLLRAHHLANLKPSPHSRLLPARQEAEIEFIKKHRKESFFFLGPPGTSKTTFAAAIFNARLWDDTVGHQSGQLWRVDGRKLFESEHEWVMANDKESVRREITVREIRRARSYHVQPVLLLEEIDKRRMTEFNADTLFGLIDALVENEGQLILTSNLTRQGFTDLFMKSDHDAVRTCGGALLRRVLENPRVNVRDYHR